MQGHSSTSKVPRTCLFCGKDFLAFAHNVQKGHGKYCSHKCHYANRRPDTATIVTCRCSHCGKEFTRKRKYLKRSANLFCSHRCSTEHNVIHLADRYWARVVKSQGCWGWTGSRLPAGYGQITVKKTGEHVYAHRFSYELHKGPIPEGMKVLHSCDNPPCSNPDHLFLGTDADNHADKVRKGRQLRGETQPGHILTEQQVKDIREKYKPGYGNYTKLAREYGVHRVTISDIITRRTWDHIP